MGKHLQRVLTTDAEGNKKLVVAEVALGDGKDLLSVDITDTNYKAGTETFELEMARKETSILFNKFPQFEVVDVKARKKEEQDILNKAEEMKDKFNGGSKNGEKVTKNDEKDPKEPQKDPKKVGQGNEFPKKDEKSETEADNEEVEGVETSSDDQYEEFYNLVDKLAREGLNNDFKGANVDKYRRGAVGYIVLPSQEEGELPTVFWVNTFTTRYIGKKLVYMETNIPYTSQHSLTIKVRKGSIDFEVYNTSNGEMEGGSTEKAKKSKKPKKKFFGFGKNKEENSEKDNSPKKVDKNNANFLEDMGVDTSDYEVDENGNIQEINMENHFEVPEGLFCAGVIKNLGTYSKDENYWKLRDFTIIDGELVNLDHLYKNALIENEFAGTKLVVNSDEVDDEGGANQYATNTRKALKSGMIIEVGDLDDGNWENLQGNMASSKDAFDIYYKHRAKMMMKIARKEASDGEGGAQKGSLETFANNAIQEYFMNDKRMVIEPQLAKLMEIIATLHLDIEFNEGLYVECNIPVHQERPSKEEVERIIAMRDAGFITDDMAIMEANGVTKGKAKVIGAETSIKLQEEKDREMMMMQEQGNEGNPEQNGGNPFNEKKDPMSKTKPGSEKKE